MCIAKEKTRKEDEKFCGLWREIWAVNFGLTG